MSENGTMIKIRFIPREVKAGTAELIAEAVEATEEVTGEDMGERIETVQGPV